MFAALEVATGKVTDACYPRHRSDEFLRFLKLVAKTYPRVKLHVVVDNYAAHKHPRVNAWLARNPRIMLHFTPTSGSWLNLVEIFFGIITRQAIRRGTFDLHLHTRTLRSHRQDIAHFEVLEIWKDLVSTVHAQTKQVLDPVIRVHATPAAAHLHQPRPYRVRWRSDGDSPSRHDVRIRKEVVAGHLTIDLV